MGLSMGGTLHVRGGVFHVSEVKGAICTLPGPGIVAKLLSSSSPRGENSQKPIFVALVSSGNCEKNGTFYSHIHISNCEDV